MAIFMSLSACLKGASLLMAMPKSPFLFIAVFAFWLMAAEMTWDVVF